MLRHAFLLVDLTLNVQVDTEDQDIREDVYGPDAIQDHRVLEVDLFRDLHHDKNDDQVGADRVFKSASEVST
jgi:hypothetical protein